MVALLKKLEERDDKMKTALAASLSHIQDEVEQLARSKKSDNSSEIAQKLGQLQNQVQDVSKVQLLLDSFRFDAMRAREVRVVERHAQTFQWMFSSESSFTRWLPSSSGLFWITGKAGSGKSTMMKFLFESQETHSRLDSWGGDRRLVISRHFFWHAGTAIQKSFRGLLQEICYDIFRACPGLLPLLCKDKWASISGKKCLMSNDHLTSTWSEVEMAAMIKHIGESDLVSDGRATCLFILIDGLDEFHGQHDELSNAIIALSQLQNIKICVSSRPWNVFKEYFAELFSDQRCLVMQDLTKQDIAQYVRNRLEENRVFLQMLQRDDRCSQLALEITEKADGVFLWVFLVINELLKSLLNHDDYSTLLRRIRGIPPGLEPYFKYMFDNLDQFYKFETAQILRAAVVSTYELPLLALSVIFSTEPMAVQLLSHEKPGLQEVDIGNFEDILERRMVGCCGDLLETKDRRINFLHRTVRDFLATAEMTAELDGRAGKAFDIDVTMCRMAIVDVMRYQQSSQAGKRWLVQFYTHARKLEDKTQQAPVDLHDALQKAFASATGLQRFSSEYRLFVLAAMNLTLELKRSLKATGLFNSASILQRCSQEALEYLLYPRLLYIRAGTRKSEDDASEDLANDEDASGEQSVQVNVIAVPDLISKAVELDPDRRDFRVETLALLLKYGADPSELWSQALPRMYSEKARRSEYRRGLFLKVSSVLMQAGAAETFLPAAKSRKAFPRTRHPKSRSESEMLEKIFGLSDTQWLLSQRQGSSLPSGHDVPGVLGEAKDSSFRTRDIQAQLSAPGAPTRRLGSMFSWLMGR